MSSRLLENEFVVLDELIDHAMGTGNGSEMLDILTDGGNVACESDLVSHIRLYQVIGNVNKRGVFLKDLGKHSTNRPTIVIHEFRFRKYEIKLVSYLLCDVDLEFADERCELKMLGLLVNRPADRKEKKSSKLDEVNGSDGSDGSNGSNGSNGSDGSDGSNGSNGSNGIIAAITMSFFTFDHKRSKRSISDYVAGQELLSGFFAYELKTINHDGVIKAERLGPILNEFPGRTKSVYRLVELLSDDKLKFLF